MVFGNLLLTGVSNKKMDFTMLLVTLKPLDRHPTCLCLNKLFFFTLLCICKNFKSKLM